ncbi:MAG: ATP-dependent DNA helicase RecG [Brevinema sp.]
MKSPELHHIPLTQHYTERQTFLLSKLGLFSIEDLLTYFPFRYEDRNQISTLAEAILNKNSAVIKATVHTHSSFFWNNKRCTKITIKDSSATAELVNFNIPKLETQMPIGQEFFIYGKFDFRYNKIQASTFEFESLDKFGEKDSVLGRIFSVYRVTEGLKLKEFHKIIKKVFDLYLTEVIDPIPFYFLEKRNLFTKINTIKELHFPSDFVKLEKARIRGAYEEFLSTRIGLELKRKIETKILKKQEYPKTTILKELQQILPFSMTEAQERVIGEIIHDLNKPFTMHRLVQGDVGSGKTTVALAAMLIAANNGYQSAFLAPTELLAFQHYKKIAPIAEQLGVSCSLLTGSISTKDRKPILSNLADGKLSIIIGTHALFQHEVYYHDLSLVIIDEQHKFGVEQRSSFINKGNNPDILVMTATPIPRTITLSLYGDLDISVIDEMPAGRQIIETSQIKAKNYPFMLNKVREEISLGRQVFVVCPLIEENEMLENTKSAEQVFSEYQQYFPEYCVALVHGRMSQLEKDSIMKEFSENKSQILVATTVIEVGIDIPNATLMIIENGERFGLAQLHQLRGRVGRGEYKSYCFVINYGSGADHRLNIFCSTTDGFVIAEEDLKIRGPGELLGTRQTGTPMFRLADFSKDQKILQTAINDAQLIMSKDSLLELVSHQALKKFIDLETHIRIFSG